MKIPNTSLIINERRGYNKTCNTATVTRSVQDIPILQINTLNNQIALLNLPAIILLGIFMITGIIGNVLGLYINIFKIR